MTNEATFIELYGNNGDGRPVQCTVASNAAINTGSIIVLSDPNTGALAASAGQPTIGISAFEKKNNDYSTKLTCYTDGLFGLVASGAITVGAPVTTATTGSLNYISQAVGMNETTASLAMNFGIAKSTASDNERIPVRINL